MLKEKITCFILSCDKFSDLWEGNIKMLNHFWPDKAFDVFLVTDNNTDRVIEGVTILSMGADVEWSDRLKKALSFVKTPFVFLTLDDYFLIEKVDNKKFCSLIHLMENERLDYLRMFPDPVRSAKEEIRGYKGIYRIDKSYEYSVNLYQGLWNKQFLSYCLKEPQNAWHFEVGLRNLAIDYDANCAVSFNNEFKVLDVVRKGKLLRKANRYFKKHPGIYNGSRPVNTWWYEFSLGIKDWGQRHIPERMLPFARKVLALFGFKFYSTNSL